MTRVPALVAVIVVVAAVAAASSVAAAPAGLAPATIPDYGISLSVPSGWSHRKPPSGTAGGLLKYLFLARTASSGFRANLNLVVAPLGRGQTLRQWMFSGASAAYQYAGTTKPITVDGVHGLHYRSTRAVKFGKVPLLTDEYAFLEGDRVFLFTYTALAEQRGTLAPLFTRSAATIQFPSTGSAPGTPA